MINIHSICTFKRLFIQIIPIKKDRQMEKVRYFESLAKDQLEKRSENKITTGSSIPAFDTPYPMSLSNQHNLYLLLVQSSIITHTPSLFSIFLQKLRSSYKNFIW